MMKLLLSLALLPLAACCTAPPPTESVESEPETAQFAPESVEEQEMAATRAQRSGGNTYAQTCGALRRKLDASALPAALNARVEAGDAQKLNPSRQLTLKAAATLDSSHAELLANRKSVVCRIVTDLSADGRAVNPVANCTDDAYEDYVATYIASSEYEPYLGPDNQPAPISGAVTYWEKCTSD